VTADGLDDVPPPSDADAPQEVPQRPQKPPRTWTRDKVYRVASIMDCVACGQPIGKNWRAIMWIGKTSKTDRGIKRTTHDNGVCHPSNSEAA